MASKMTSLSAGKILWKLLTEDAAISGMVTKVFPVVTDTAQLPYIAYRRMKIEPGAFKTGNADTIQVEVFCFSEDYEGSIELAEAVRDALDCRQAEIEGLRMRSCLLTDGEETWQDDAYVQRLVFAIKI